MSVSPLFPVLQLPGSFEVKFSRHIVMGRCYQLGNSVFIHHCGTLRVIHLGDEPRPITFLPPNPVAGFSPPRRIKTLLEHLEEDEL